jgi:hypothetical protein
MAYIISTTGSLINDIWVEPITLGSESTIEDVMARDDYFSFTYILTELTVDQLEKPWRDKELKDTDSDSLLTDHSGYDALITYRQALRNWPSTDSYPSIRPTL